jgi:hypothetical protein
MARVQKEYLAAESFTNVNYYKGFESWISMPLMNLQWLQGIAPDARVTQPSSPSSTTTGSQPAAPSTSAPASIPVTVETPAAGTGLSGRGATKAGSDKAVTPPARQRASAAAVQLHVTRSTRSGLPAITLMNAPRGGTVTISLTARTVMPGRGRKQVTRFVHLRTTTIHVSKSRIVVRLGLTKHQLRTLGARRWTLVTKVKMMRGRVVRRLGAVVRGVSFVLKRS